MENRLKKIDELFEKGVITEEERKFLRTKTIKEYGFTNEEETRVESNSSSKIIYAKKL